MKRAAESDHHVAARIRMFIYRTREEFYDFENDPNALNNLIDDPAYREEIEDFRKMMKEWMESTNDPARVAFRELSSETNRQRFLEKLKETLGGK
ncbi:MAG: hypothetical protein ACLFUS_10320 [Candidatus Sumerlaeia bacterium]